MRRRDFLKALGIGAAGVALGVKAAKAKPGLRVAELGRVPRPMEPICLLIVRAEAPPGGPAICQIQFAGVEITNRQEDGYFYRGDPLYWAQRYFWEEEHVGSGAYEHATASVGRIVWRPRSMLSPYDLITRRFLSSRRITWEGGDLIRRRIRYDHTRAYGDVAPPTRGSRP